MPYRDAGLNDRDRERVRALGEQWQAAMASGNQGLADQYHRQAEAIRAQYGYSGGTGGDEYHPIDLGDQQPRLAPAKVTGAVSQEQTLRDLAKARQESAAADLTAAYRQSLEELESAQSDVAPRYQQLRRQAAGEAAVSRRSYQEQAAAAGLGSGTTGQAELSMSVAQQQRAGMLDAQQSKELSDLALQRIRLETQYQQALAKTAAEGNAQLAQNLYQEAVRVDESHQAAQQQNAQMTYQYDRLESEQTRQQLARKAQADSTAFQQMLALWQNSPGGAPPVVANYFGIPVGTRTSDQVYQDAQLALARYRAYR